MCTEAGGDDASMHTKYGGWELGMQKGARVSLMKAWCLLKTAHQAGDDLSRKHSGELEKAKR
jgi:hypothetical protein